MVWIPCDSGLPGLCWSVAIALQLCSCKAGGGCSWIYSRPTVIHNPWLVDWLSHTIDDCQHCLFCSLESHIGGSCWFCAGHKAPSGLLVVQGSQRCRVLEAASKCLGSCLLLVTGHSSQESLSQWVQITNRWLHHERSARPASTYCKPALSTVYGTTPNNNCCTPTNRRQHNSFTPRQLV